MQVVSCPSCGAEVSFRSHASVMAVCEYCNTRVLKDAGAVQNLGKIGSVLEDYSPLCLNASGVLGGRAFTVIGRIQLRYAAGMWNEWYLQFDDGSNGWLGDASGQYTVTTLRKPEGQLPAFEQLAPGKQYVIGKETYTAADIRSAECSGGQGELPFKVGDGWQARVADLRLGESFVTLDYSDGPQPQLYHGIAVTLGSMQMQLLRDDEQIRRTAGRYRGKLDALNCPSCGSAIKYLPGLTASLVCQSCQTSIDAASPQAQVLAAGTKLEQVPTSLELGASGKLGNQEYTVLGILRRQDDEGSSWTEYLLYSGRKGFTWLVETDEGWFRSNVMDKWPTWSGPAALLCTFEKINYAKLYDYSAKVTFAAGAFNWRVSVGDEAKVYEFKQGVVQLAAELTGEELSWSRATPMSRDQVKAWFGAAYRGPEPDAPLLDSAAGKRYTSVAKGMIMMLLAINAIPLLASFTSTFMYSVIAVLAIYIPAKILDAMDK
ncbi:DUF4178 domain-containing protein [Massilia sp. NR 4-1]|uniref:DUF4178 domain-containing protein n=1 Tax=Massilia sp. NR 4-1 TaxID=1678028 RepID=UPI00067B462A|nr:DUF4178 domain-containing protein [Massilia sp. NR 4-1]AKU23214.1 hypothetical protein ACZ75_18865 [Massilia sp. NR 4-1]